MFRPMTILKPDQKVLGRHRLRDHDAGTLAFSAIKTQLPITAEYRLSKGHFHLITICFHQVIS